MAISYNNLWKILVDRKTNKADLRKAAGIAPNTMTRLRRDEEVTLTVLNNICTALNVDIGANSSKTICGGITSLLDMYLHHAQMPAFAGTYRLRACCNRC